MKKFLLSILCLFCIIGYATADEAKFDFTAPSGLTPSITDDLFSDGGNGALAFGTSGTTFTNNGVTLNTTDGSSTVSRIWKATNGTYDLRVYKTATMTIAAPEGGVITAIAFTGNTVKSFSANSGTVDGKNWTGATTSVVFTWADDAGTQKINTITVTFSTDGSVTPDQGGDGEGGDESPCSVGPDIHIDVIDTAEVKSQIVSGGVDIHFVAVDTACNVSSGINFSGVVEEAEEIPVSGHIVEIEVFAAVDAAVSAVDLFDTFKGACDLKGVALAEAEGIVTGTEVKVTADPGAGILAEREGIITCAEVNTVGGKAAALAETDGVAAVAAVEGSGDVDSAVLAGAQRIIAGAEINAGGGKAAALAETDGVVACAAVKSSVDVDGAVLAGADGVVACAGDEVAADLDFSVLA